MLALITVSLDNNLNKILDEKRMNYQGLAVELKDLYRIKENNLGIISVND